MLVDQLRASLHLQGCSPLCPLAMALQPRPHTAAGGVRTHGGATDALRSCAALTSLDIGPPCVAWA
eukprot:2258677-Alexandrium_andersonii.AAC.1